MFLCKKQRNIREKCDKNLQKLWYFQYFQPGKNFSQKSDSAMFWALLIRIFVQKIRKNQWWNLEKMPKNRFFRHISGIFGRKIFFFKNRAPSLFGHCHFGSLCQKSEKTNGSIPRKAGNRRTNKRTWVNLKDLQSRSKKWNRLEDTERVNLWKKWKVEHTFP